MLMDFAKDCIMSPGSKRFQICIKAIQSQSCFITLSENELIISSHFDTRSFIIEHINLYNIIVSINKDLPK